MSHEIPESWRDFFNLVGCAAATLVGLMFVAASVGAGVFTEERQVGLRTLLSPTVVAFSVVLAACIIGVLPTPNWIVPTILLSAIGLFGIAYSLLILRRMIQNGITAKIDHEDRLWYAFAPILAYLVLTASGIAFAVGSEAAAAVLAAGICMLLIAGIRNAWDMTTWVVLRRNS